MKLKFGLRKSVRMRLNNTWHTWLNNNNCQIPRLVSDLTLDHSLWASRWPKRQTLARLKNKILMKMEINTTILQLTSSCLLMQTRMWCKRSPQTVTSFSMLKMNWTPIQRAKMKFKSILQNPVTASLFFAKRQALRLNSLIATSMLTSTSASSA